MNLYTVDLSPQNLLKTIGINPHVQRTPFEKKKMKVNHNLARDRLLATLEKKRVTNNMWVSDKDIAAMR